MFGGAGAFSGSFGGGLGGIGGGASAVGRSVSAPVGVGATDSWLGGAVPLPSEISSEALQPGQQQDDDGGSSLLPSFFGFDAK
jgi:hypothetical protein